MSMSAEATARLSRWAFLLPVALVLGAYLHALDGGFVWDDHMLIEEQKVVQELGPPSEYFLRMFWSDPLKVSRGFYRPLVTWSYALEWQLWGGQPAGFHLTNVLLHLGCVLLVFRLGRRCGAGPLASALGASAFGLFPRLTETVAWISGRTDSMAALAALGCLLLYDAAPGAWRRRVLAGLVLLPGLFCKEVALAVVPGLFALEAIHVLCERRPLRRSLLHLAPVVAAVGVYGAMRLFAQSQDTRGVSIASSVELAPSARLLASLAGLGNYVRMALDPLRPELQAGSPSHAPLWLVLLGAATLVLAAVGLWRARLRLAPLQVGTMAMGAAALLMVLHIFLPLNVLGADRFMYVPVAAAAAVLALPLERLLRRAPRAALAASLAALGALGAGTYARILDWNDEYRLWTHAVQSRSPGQSTPLMGMAEYLMDQALYDRALVLLEQATKEEQQLPAYNNLALVLSKLGRHAEAAALFEDMVRKYPAAQLARLNLVMAYARMGRWDKAEEHLQVVERQSPGLDVVPNLRALFQRSRDTLAALPASGEGGAQALVRRALVADELGAPHEAGVAWRAVLDAKDCTPEQRLRAVGFLVFNGNLALAQTAVARMRQEQPQLAELALFEQELARRDRLR